MKKQGLVYLALAALAGLTGERLHAQNVDLKYATYGTDSPTAGAAPVTAVTNTLGPVTVNQIYTNSTSTYTFNFISDGSGVFNYIYEPISTSAPDPFVAGDTYTGLSLTSSPFGTPANLELTVASANSAAALIPTAVGSTETFTPVAEGLLTTTSTITDNYSSAPPLDIQPVQFTFTAPTTQTVTPISGSSTITDANNGDKISFYRPTGGLSFVAGTTYTIDGTAFAYSTGIEIYDPAIAGTVPEPSTDALLGICTVAAFFAFSRVRRNTRG